MDQSVPQAAASLLVDVAEPVVGADPLAARREVDLDEVNEAPAEHFRVGAVGPAADQSAALALEDRAVAAPELVTVGRADREVQQAVRPEGQAVEAAVVRVPEAAQDDGPPIGSAFPFGILQDDEVRGVCDVELAVAPGESHREDEVTGENPRLAKPSVRPAAFQEADAAASRLRRSAA